MNNSDDKRLKPIPELVGKTITEACIVTDEGGNDDVVLRCSDGTVFSVTAWQEEGYPLQMDVIEEKCRAFLKN